MWRQQHVQRPCGGREQDKHKYLKITQCIWSLDYVEKW